MSSTKPWGGGIGAWALESEQAEAEEAAASAALAASATTPAVDNFPSIKEAMSTKQKKKKKGTTFSLSEFTSGKTGKDSIFEPKGLTQDDLMRLPTGPRERSAEELESGRGFRGFGGFGGERRGFDEERGRGGRDFESQPSRADGVDNWGAGKKAFGSTERRGERYESLGGSARADEVDNWSVGKKQVQFQAQSTLNRGGAGGGFGSGFRDSDSERWGRGGGGTASFNAGERTRLVLDPPKVVKESEVVVKTRASPFGAARPREEVLSEKGVDWRKVDSEIEGKKGGGSRPTSSQSSRPSSPQSSRGEGELGVKPRPKVNPFGDAKPREVVLEEKGKDWRKIDLELEHLSVDRPETEQEKLLKEEISHLKNTVSKANDEIAAGKTAEFSTEQLATLQDQITAREKELEQLIHELDDKVKFGQKATGAMRPGSGASRIDSFSDRPPSRSSIPDDSRNMDFMDRPGSRGSVGEIRNRPHDDRRGLHSGRDGGFFGGRDVNRSSSRERW